MKKKSAKLAKLSLEHDTSAEPEKSKAPNKMAKFFRIVVMLICVCVSFGLGNIVGGKLVEYGYRDKLQGYMAQLRTAFKGNIQKSTSKSAPSSFSGQTLQVGDVEIRSPGHTASQAEQDQFVRSIESTAKAVDRVTVTLNCALDPKVIKVSVGSTIVFMNNDTVDHSLKFGENKYIATMSAGMEYSITPSDDVVGIHGIVCLGTSNLVGFLQVTK